MAKRISLSSDRLDFEEIALHNTVLENSIVLYYSKKNPDYESRFSLYSDEEILVERQHRKSETESAMAMVLLVAIEASFRVDYFKRCDQKLKDQLSREFRKLYKKKDRRVSLEDEILELWKIHADVPVALIGEIRDVFKYRHWLAHGRYWVPKFGRSYDFLSVYRLADTVNREFSLER